MIQKGDHRPGHTGMSETRQFQTFVPSQRTSGLGIAPAGLRKSADTGGGPK